MSAARHATLFAVACSVLGGCQCQPDQAILLKVTVEPELAASCVQVEVRSTQGAVLAERKLSRNKDELRVAVWRADLPAELSFAARPLFGKGCEEPLLPNGAPVAASAAFSKGVTEVLLALRHSPSDDQDGDRHLAKSGGGSDCDDADPASYPGAEESCEQKADRNCNGLVGCADLACAGRRCLGPPAKLVFTTDAQSVVRGDCSQVVEVRLEDALGHPSTFPAAVNLSLVSGPAPGLQLFSEGPCTTPLELLPLATGESTSRFYFRSSVPGVFTLTVTAPSLPQAHQVQIVNPSSPTQLAFTTLPRAALSSSCSAKLNLEVQDAAGYASPLTAPAEIALSAAPSSAAFYSDSSCSTAVTKLSLAKETTGASFYFKGSQAGKFEITAAAGQLTPAKQSASIAAGPPVRLSFVTQSRTVQAGICSPVVAVSTLDSSGNVSPLTQAATLTLSSAPSVGFGFFSDSSCFTSTNQISMNVGDSQANFYFKGTTAQQVTVTVTPPAGWSPVTQTQTIEAGPPSSMLIVSAGQTIPAGNCSAPVSFITLDSHGNRSPVFADTTVNLASNPTGLTFFAGPTGCTNPTNAVTLAASTSQGSLYFQRNSPGSVQVILSSPGLGNAQQTETIDPLPATVLAFATVARTEEAGKCSAEVTLETRDSLGNPTPVSADTTVNLTTPASAGMELFADSSCSISSKVTSLALGKGTWRGTFHFKGSKAQPVAITANATNATNFTGNSQTQIIIPAPPDRVRFTTSGQTVAAGNCSGQVDLTAMDPYGNGSTIRPVDEVVELDAGSATGFSFFSNSGCTNKIVTSPPQVRIAAGSKTASFYFAGEVSGAVTITAKPQSGRSGDSQQEIITPGPPAALSYSTITASPLQAGKCSPVATVVSRDKFGNLTNSAVTLNLTAAPGTVRFYSGPGCAAAAITSVNIPSGSSSADFYFRGLSGGTQQITASGAGVATTGNIEIIPAVRTGPCTLTAASTSVTCPFSPDLFDRNKTMLFFQAINAEDTPESANVRCSLSNTNSITCSRPAGGAETRIAYSTLELANGLTVQHHEVTGCANPTSVFLSPAVTPSRTFILASSERGNLGGEVSGDAFRTFYLADAGTVEITSSGGSCDPSEKSSLQVVELAGANVERGKKGPMTGSSLSVTGLPSAALGRSFLLYSYRTQSTGPEMCRRAIQGFLGSNSTVDFARSSLPPGCISDPIDEIAFERVTLPQGHRVQAHSVPMVGDTASIPISAVDLTRTVSFAGGQWSGGQAQGMGSYDQNDIPGEMRALHQLASPTSLKLTRASSQGSAMWTSFVVEMVP